MFYLNRVWGLRFNMAKKRVSFWATKKKTVPIKVSFRNRYGEKVSFRATKKVSVPVKVNFYAKKRRRKW